MYSDSNIMSLSIKPTFKQLQHFQRRFRREIETAFQAYQKREQNHTSLPFIQNRLPTKPMLQNGESFQVIVIGGTYVRSALCRISQRSDNGFTYAKRPKVSALPNITSQNDFVSYLTDQVYPCVQRVVLVMANALKPAFTDGRLDGQLIEVSDEKALAAHDLVGKYIGKEIESKLSIRLKRTVILSVVNDGICLLLSGLKKRRMHQGLVFGIAGTGINFGFLLADDICINLESAEFDAFVPSATGAALAEQRLGSPFGRETNGKFLCLHFNNHLKKRRLAYPPLASTEELSTLASKNVPCVSKLAQSILYRSASLVACQIAGIADFLRRDICCIMEGSLFWKGYNYRQKVSKVVRKLTQKDVEFLKIPNGEIVGATKLIA